MAGLSRSSTWTCVRCPLQSSTKSRSVVDAAHAGLSTATSTTLKMIYPLPTKWQSFCKDHWKEQSPKNVLHGFKWPIHPHLLLPLLSLTVHGKLFSIHLHWKILLLRIRIAGFYKTYIVMPSSIFCNKLCMEHCLANIFVNNSSFAHCNYYLRQQLHFYILSSLLSSPLHETQFLLNVFIVLLKFS